jgi:hypothetical protein
MASWRSDSERSAPSSTAIPAHAAFPAPEPGAAATAVKSGARSPDAAGTPADRKTRAGRRASDLGSNGGSQHQAKSTSGGHGPSLADESE